ncbi:ketopantoate reductase [Planomicrobium soli]|uniref:2-dehydropantoate 2-reductase n=1 Tax=Planomicrobium soli TaxID=1176648 RepID=A0A2P8H2H3_9BACL|nr:ketopantoate reductase family protein [Planomicrobium soli]PSL40414.1 ketopantoate reductase [Planomicrobium soli]
MKILVVGAGGIGGYFGARLLEAGQDVTFLVRERRKKQLEETGLNVHSVNGDVHLEPKLVTAENSVDQYDLIILTVKSYQLPDAIQDIRPFVGKESMILPLLNGFAHIGELANVFSEEQVLGGLCFIETTLDHEGTIIQTSPMHQLVFGERSGEETERILRVKKALSGTKADFALSRNIIQDMWHKYLFIAAMSGITASMESPIGPVRELESGKRTISALLEELTAVMKGAAAPIKETIAEEQFKKIMSLDPGMKSSMQRDVEKGHSIEVDHLQGYLLKKAKSQQLAVPVLETIYTKLKLYELQ